MMAEFNDTNIEQGEGSKAQHSAGGTFLYPVNSRVPIIKDVKENYGTGHVKIYRSLREHWLWKASVKKTKLEAWLDLLMMAAYEDTKEPFGYDLIILKRGQILTSQDKLSKSWLWDRSAVRGFLQQLELDAMIVVKTTSKYTMITICNYASYHDKQPSRQQVSNNKTTSKQHIEESKEIKEYNSTSPKPIFEFSHNGFFDRQLEKNKEAAEISKYRKLVEHLHSKDDEGKDLFGNILSLKKQISFKDYLALKEVEKESTRTLKDVLEAMENKEGLKKNYQNVYLTAKNWLKKEFKN